MRRAARAKRLDERRSAQALTSYVALAEALDAVLLTADGRIKRASGIHCEIAVLG